MPRDTTVRSRVIEYLAAQGSIRDTGGRATGRLKDAVGYAGGDAGFIRVVSLMAEAGELEREVKGKRTYRISLGPEAKVPAKPSTPMPAGPVDSAPGAGAPSLGEQIAEGAIDYDELASSLLVRVASVLSESESARSSGGEQSAWARRRIDQLEVRLAALQRDLARAKAETQAVKDERDEVRSQLEAASHNLELLTERLGTQGRPQQRAADRLGSEEQALLYRLRDPRQSKPTRVG